MQNSSESPMDVRANKRIKSEWVVAVGIPIFARNLNKSRNPAGKAQV